MSGIANAARAAILALAVCAASIGCHGPLRIPQIDPTGARIFLPAPNSTTLVGAPGLLTNIPPNPAPAFADAPTPPPCPFPAPPSPALASPPMIGGCRLLPPRPTTRTARRVEPGKLGEITLAPSRIIAPVGGQVVLQAGLCGNDGFYRTNERLHWNLAQDGVGQLVDVGPQTRLSSIHLDRRPLSTGFAVCRTASQDQVITRGTPNPTDDVTLLSGQGWVAVTSPSEGVSRVTVMAPDAKVWDQRLKTATIYWVDASWAIPPAQSVRAGDRHLLSTRVMRSGGDVPAEGWRVRYSIVNDSAAQFLPEGQPVVERTVDSRGQADVEIESNAPGGTTAQVQVQIVRPPQAGDLPEMIIGQGFTTVTWRAPNLTVRADGPATAGINSVVTYRVEVANPGELETRDVVLRDQLPQGLVFLDSDPPASVFGNRHEWRIGNLQPGSSWGVTIRCRSDFERRVRYSFEATSSVDAISDQADVETFIRKPSLAVEMLGPDEAELGETVTYEVRVSNTGTLDFANVDVIDRYQPGLRQTEDRPSPIYRRIGPLKAGETKRFGISFVCQQPGRLCHTMQAIADDGQQASQERCVEVSQPEPRPQLGVQVTAPVEVQTGDSITHRWTVTNRGNVPLNDIEVTFDFDAELDPKEATEGNPLRRVGRQLIWTLPTLEVGRSKDFQVQSVALRPAAAATAQVTASTADNIRASDAAATRITNAVNPPVNPDPVNPRPVDPGPPRPVDPGAGNPPAGNGKLDVSIFELGDPIPLNGNTTYLITITNNRQQFDNNVVLDLELAPGMKFADVKSPVRVKSSSQDGLRMEFTPIATLRPGGKSHTFRIDVTGTTVGEKTIRAIVRSQLSPAGVEASESTTVVEARP